MNRTGIIFQIDRRNRNQFMQPLVETRNRRNGCKAGHVREFTDQTRQNSPKHKAAQVDALQT